jgi:hypothetical protein
VNKQKGNKMENQITQMENQITQIECNGVPINASVEAIVNAINAQKDCSKKQLFNVVDAFCDAIADTRDYAAQQAAIVGKSLDSKLDALAEKVEAKSDSKFTPEDAIKLIDDVKKVIDEANKKAADDLKESLKDELLVIEKITPELIVTVNTLIEKLKDSTALEALIGIQTDLRKIKETVADLVTVSKDNADKLANLESKVVTQNNINCTLKQAFTDLANAIVVDCEAQTAETNTALSCVRASIGSKSQYEYQASGNPADLAPSMTIPVLDTVVTPVYEQPSVTDTVEPTVVDTTFVEPTVSPAMEAPTYVEPVVEVVAPEVIVEPTFVVTSETVDGVLFEVLSDGNMRKTDIDGTVTTTNSMGDLV